jgi:hypothetical protein
MTINSVLKKCNHFVVSHLNSVLKNVIILRRPLRVLQAHG